MVRAHNITSHPDHRDSGLYCAYGNTHWKTYPPQQTKSGPAGRTTVRGNRWSPRNYPPADWPARPSFPGRARAGPEVGVGTGLWAGLLQWVIRRGIIVALGNTWVYGLMGRSRNLATMLGSISTTPRGFVSWLDGSRKNASLCLVSRRLRYRPVQALLVSRVRLGRQ